MTRSTRITIETGLAADLPRPYFRSLMVRKPDARRRSKWVALEITENLSNLLPYELKEWLKSGALHRSADAGGRGVGSA